MAEKNKNPRAKSAGRTSFSLEMAASRLLAAVSDNRLTARPSRAIQASSLLVFTFNNQSPTSEKRFWLMSLKEYAEKRQRPKKRRVGPILGAVALVVVIVGALAFYHSAGVASNTVYCFVGQYLEFGATTVVHGTMSNVTETMTTAVSYTTSTSITGSVGHTYANSTTTVNKAGLKAGVETICKYISNTNSSSSSSS